MKKKQAKVESLARSHLCSLKPVSAKLLPKTNNKRVVKMRSGKEMRAMQEGHSWLLKAQIISLTKGGFSQSKAKTIVVANQKKSMT
jgi:hypothetical protein